MKKRISLPRLGSFGALAALAFTSANAEEATSATSNQLKQALKLYPDADLNRDGILTQSEALQAAKAAGIDISKGIPGVINEGDILRSNITYGPETRQVLDFWQPKSEKPTPVVIFIHGGGFKGGDKSQFSKSAQMAQFRTVLLNQGIACAAINYRFTNTAPLQDILRDGARAAQFLRSKSAEWNIDKARFGAVGGSAGAGMSLWMATRDDLGDAKNPDPVLRESSRVGPVVLIATQATYNFPRWDAFLGKPGFQQEPNEAAKLFHLASNEEFATPSGQSLLKECDMLEWISAGEGPILAYASDKPGTNATWDGYVHNPLHAREIKKACDKAGATCELFNGSGARPVEFLISNLR